MAQGDVRTATRDRRNQQREETGGQNGQLSGKALAIRPDQEIWDPNQRAALEAIGVEQASQAELAVFFHVCQKTGLNPFLKQIYMIRRWVWDADLGHRVPKQTIQVGIDGFRIVRERAANRDGWRAEFEETIWYDDKGRPSELWLRDTPPFACKVVLVKVYADGQRLRVPHIVRWDAYVDTYSDDHKDPAKRGQPKNRWAVDGAGMLAKCAETGASRKAAPQDLAGLYITEEMEAEAGGPHPWRTRPPVTTATVVNPEETAQPGADVPGPAADPAADPDAANQRKAALGRIHALFREHGWGDQGNDKHHAVRVAVCANLAREGVDDPYPPLRSTADLDVWQADRVAERLAAYLAEKKDGHQALGRMAGAVVKQMQVAQQ